MSERYGVNQRHREIIQAFDEGKLRVEFGFDGQPIIIGRTGKPRSATGSTGYRRTTVPWSGNTRLRESGKPRKDREESVHIITWLWKHRTEFDTKSFNVHHKNGNKLDNSLDNLSLEDKSSHGKILHPKVISIDELSVSHKALIENILENAPNPNLQSISTIFNLKFSLMEHMARNRNLLR